MLFITIFDNRTLMKSTHKYYLLIKIERATSPLLVANFPLNPFCSAAGIGRNPGTPGTAPAGSGPMK